MKKTIPFAILIISTIISLLTTYLALNFIEKYASDYYDLISILFFVFLFYIIIVLLVNIFLARNIKIGKFEEDPVINYTYLKIIELVYQPLVYIIPVLLSSLILKGFGAKIGKSTITGLSYIEIPALLVTGKNCVIGGFSTINSRSIENNKIIYKKVILEDNTTIGANAIVEPGVIVGRGSIVAPGSYVKQNTIIPERQLWGGIPAKFIKKLK